MKLKISAVNFFAPFSNMVHVLYFSYTLPSFLEKNLTFPEKYSKSR